MASEGKSIEKSMLKPPLQGPEKEEDRQLYSPSLKETLFIAKAGE